MSRPDDSGGHPSVEQQQTEPSALSAAIDDVLPEDSARRRAVDIAVAAALQKIGYDLGHPIAQMTVKHLQQTGAGSLIKVWTSRDLFSRCCRLGVFRLPEPPADWPTEAGSLLAMAAAEAASDFVASRLSTWRPNGGASILTYFVNYTLMNDFKSMYCAYCRREQRRERHEVEYDEAGLAECPLDHSSDQFNKVLDGRLIKEAQRHMTPRIARIFELIGEGLEQKEIAEAMQLHPRTIRRQVRSFQLQLRDEYGWTIEDGAR